MSTADETIQKAKQAQAAAAAAEYQRQLNSPLTSSAQALANKNKKRRKKKAAAKTSSQGAASQAHAQAASAAGNANAAGISPDAGNPFAGAAGFNVYTGVAPGTTSFPLPPGTHRVNEPAEATTEDAALTLRNEFVGKSKQEISDLQDRLKKAGYPGVAVTGVVDQDTVTAYTKMLQDVRLSNEAGSRLTPDQYLAEKIAGGHKAAATTHTTSSVNLSSPEAARATALSQFEQSLGRRPSQGELDAFYQALRAYESSHPTFTTDTTSGDGLTDRTSTTGGAGDPAAFAQQYVDQNFGGQEGQHDALHYFDLINQVLTGPPVGIQHAMA